MNNNREEQVSYGINSWWDLAASLLGAMVLLLLIAFSDNLAFLWPLRLVLGIPFVLFMPGYWLVAALFPRTTDMDGLVRLALSIGLSIAVMPPLALVLEWLPWGIFLWPITAAYGAYYVVVIPVAVIQRLRLPPGERFSPQFELDLKGWWAAQDRTKRIIYYVILGAFVVAIISSIALIFSPKPGEHFTEFYILGEEGLVESYPREGTAGEPLAVMVGVTNREGEAYTFRVEARDETGVIGEIVPFRLEDEETRRREMIFIPRETGEDVRVEFTLYRETDPEPYRTLRLWLEINPP